MSETINWLHLTDLHLGLDKQNWHWPRTKNLIFQDIKLLGQQLGPWDLVFFTGDFVQQGSKDEYKKLEELLGELWGEFRKSGSSPFLCTLPGNHDLVRPDPDTPALKAMKLWWTPDEDIRTKFWTDPKSPYRELVRQSLDNYLQWLGSTTLPLLAHTKGVLPGDFSATFEKGTIKLGIVGINTTFLQLSPGDFQGKLDTHISQLNAVCDGEPDKWFREHDGAILLMHQPPDWLSTTALEQFRSDICPPGRFISILCGHQHESKASDIGEGGAAPRRIRQGASLFGLDTWDFANPDSRKRIHGYAAGQLLFEPNVGIEKLWPRKAVPRHAGGFNIAPDSSYDLKRDGSFATEFDYSSDSLTPQENDFATEAADAVDDAALNDLQLLDQQHDPNQDASRLARCPRVPIGAAPQHSDVREDEQQLSRQHLQNTRIVWIVADWGVGEAGFISASLEKLNNETFSVDAFHLRCEDAEDAESLDPLFVQQFGLSISAFLNCIRSRPNVFLVFDGIHPELAKGKKHDQLRQKIKIILDYCPELRLSYCQK